MSVSLERECSDATGIATRWKQTNKGEASGTVATFPLRKPPPKKRKDSNNYRVYREEIREDFKGYCAYCGVHESEWPHDQKNYSLDHFRPKWQFGHLKHDFYNLRWCCHICNRPDAKGEHWPSPEEEEAGMGFVDLCEDNWQMHYHILSDGTFKGLTAKAEYTIKKIGLNTGGYLKQRQEILLKGGSLFQPKEPDP